MRLGRRIFDNIKKAMAYILAIHVPIAGLSLLPVLFNWPLILSPIHIAFLELIIDPACSIVFESEGSESGLMSRPPRNPKEPLFNTRTVVLSLLQGINVLAIVLIVFLTALHRGHTEQDARALTFTSLVIANLALILTNRSWLHTIWDTLRTPNIALWWVLGGTILFLGLVLYVPFLRNLFHFARLHPADLLICFVSGVVSIAWFEALKVIRARKFSTAP